MSGIQLLKFGEETGSHISWSLEGTASVLVDMPNFETTADDFDAIGANPEATFAATRKERTAATFIANDLMCTEVAGKMMDWRRRPGNLIPGEINNCTLSRDVRGRRWIDGGRVCD
eukprot:CCRYP_013393-RC/>CCRYP_013393-RC protein AED:0.47 eAED:1.00 QI:0/0/0/1/0/0/2/0/115